MSQPASVLFREVETHTVRSRSREADFVVSNSGVDAHGTCIDQGSWDLTRYAKNPVVLWAHDSRELPIGKARVRVEGDRLLATVTFADGDVNPRAERAFRAVDAGILRGASVGFVAGEARYDAGRDVVVLSRCELLEISICPVPSNPDALKRMAEATRAAATPRTSGAPAAAPQPARVSPAEFDALWREISRLPPADAVARGPVDDLFASVIGEAKR